VNIRDIVSGEQVDRYKLDFITGDLNINYVCGEFELNTNYVCMVLN